MKKNFKKIMCVSAAIALCFLLLGAKPLYNHSGFGDGWRQAYEANGITLYYSVTECNGTSTLLLRVANSNGVARVVEMQGKVYDSGKEEFFVIGKQAPLNITVPAKKTIAGGCNPNEDKLSFHAREYVPTHKFVIASFEIQSITIK